MGPPGDVSLAFVSGPQAARAGSTPAPLQLDYRAPQLLRRYAGMVREGDALLRAVGLGGGRGARLPPGALVLDATAGLGRDAGALAFAAHARGLEGVRVLMVERDAGVAALLAQALQWARGGPAPLPWCAPDRLCLAHGVDSLQLLRALAGAPAPGSAAPRATAPPELPRLLLPCEAAPLDAAALRGADALAARGLPSARPAVVYLDPMFDEAGGEQGAGGGAAAPAPARQRTSAPQRELQFLAAAAGRASVEETRALLCAALGAATRRVVVKRHRGAPPVGSGGGRGGSAGGGSESPPLPPPSFALHSGKAVRFDVYVVAAGV